MNVNYFKPLWKSSLMILMLCFGLTSVWGQTTIAKWELTTNGTPNSVAADVTAGNFIAGSGITNFTYGSSGAYGDQWSTGAINLNDYFEVTIVPNNGYTLNVSEILFSERRSGTGIRDYQVRWSIDDFASFTTIATVNVPDNTSERSGNITGLSINVDTGETLKVRFYGYNAEAATGTWRINDNSLEIVGTVDLVSTDPVISTNIDEIHGLGYEFGSPTSTAQSFNLTGANLDGAGDVIIALDEGVNSDFEISLDDNTYDYELSIENFANGSTPIYVRLKSGLAISADYIDNITILNDYNSDVLNVLVEGAVTPPAPTTSVSETTLSGFTYVLGNGPSAEQSFTVGGANLTADITVTAPTNYQVSLTSGSGFQNSVTLTQTDGTVAETTVYIQLNAGLGVNNYNGDITVTATDVANKTIALTGSVTCGVITSFPFTETFEGDSSSRGCWTQIQETGSANWVFEAGAGGFGGAITSAYAGALNARFYNASYDVVFTKLVSPVMDISGLINPRVTFYHAQQAWGSDQNELKVFYRTNPSNEWTQLEHYTANTSTWTERFIDLPEASATYQLAFEGMSEYGYGVVLDNITVDSNIIPPTITVNPETVPAFNVVFGETDSEEIIITGLFLTENISVNLDDETHFSISDETFGTEGGTLTITYEPTTVGNHTATLTLSSTDATDVVLALNGSATFGVPVALDADPISHNKFTANWTAVPGAESYEIDVYTSEGELIETSETIVWNFGTASGNTTASSSPDFLSGLVINRGQVGGTNDALLLSNSASNYTDASGQYNATAAVKSSSTTLDTAENTYFDFTIIPESNYEINITSVSFGTRSTSTGPTRINLRQSGNYSSGITSEITVAANSAWVSRTLNFGTPFTFDSETTFRLYGYGATGSTSSSNWRIDDLTINMDVTYSTLELDYILNSVNVGNVTSYEVTGLDPATTYYYVVRAVAGEETSANSNEIEVETAPEPQTITWTTSNVWSNGDGPTIIDDAIIEGDLTLTGNLSAKTLTVAAGGKITVPANTSLTVEGKITNNGEFTVENDGILIQNNDVTNTGAITVKRNSNPMFRLDYTLWSSPVAMNLVDFSEVSATSPVAGEGTLWNRVYTLGASAWDQVWTTQPDVNNDTTPFVAGQGYLYRSPNLWVTRDSGNPATAYEGIFNGVPNNGNITATTPYEFSAIGNPYPSPIYANDFITGNAGVAFLYFWTNVNPPVDGSYNGINNWAYYSPGLGGTGVNDQFEPADNMLIQPGQGFVVSVTEGTDEVNFTNAMRRSSNGDFFRQMASDKHRFWLNLSNEEVVFNQILVGYMDNATQGVDTGIDAKMFAYEGNALYSIIENSDENYVIQGRSLPFTDSDVVALGFRAVNAGSFTISLANLDGLFADNQNIYLKDNFSQAVHNLKEGAYTFVSEEGVFNTRFEVVYQTTMSVENPVANNANWVVYSQENGFQVQTQGFELKTVQVYDLLGRTIYTANAQGTAHNIPSLGADSVYIVKVTTTENVVLSKKVR